ncbi:hypothetical protein FOZ62_028065 [Perkinsus olseni]|uniref:ER lumen protein-retaining receptor n=1 Tax=Perkinsus olseni TaxID=32597 RepID=A0A7J6RGX7_PEROL|nr:hypothetical protein FOZ62_028065 [Perkinsus olseni]
MEDVFLFELGYGIQLAAALLLLYRISTMKNIYGLSIDTQVCFLMGTLSRFIWMMDTRLVETWFSYLELWFNLAVQIALCYYCYIYWYTTTMHAPRYLRAPVLALVALLLAFLFHPGYEWVSGQVLVSFTMYIEAMGLIPQLWLMRKMMDIEPITSHYVGLLVISRAVRMVFWGVLYMQGEHFLCLFMADLLHTVFCADYLYLWCKKLRTGGRLVYAL